MISHSGILPLQQGDARMRRHLLPSPVTKESGEGLGMRARNVAAPGSFQGGESGPALGLSAFSWEFARLR
jgi:hypothetical protein